MFWIIIAILIIIALAFILPSLLRTINTQQDGRREQNIFIANEQLKELEVRFEQGEIDNEDYQSTRDELEQSLFSDINGSDETVEVISTKAPVFGTIFIVVLIPVVAIMGYLQVGNLSFVDSFDSKQAVQQIPRNADGTPDIDTMISGLQAKMEANPKNIKGWTMLGRSYMSLKRYDDAAASYERALKLEPESADLMLSLADSYAMTNNGFFQERPIELLEKALLIEPENQTALWLGGMAARQQGNLPAAIQRWSKVLKTIKSPSERESIKSLIAEAGSKLSLEERKALGIEDLEEESPSLGVTVKVSLPDSMKNEVKPDDFVFIYAKALKGPAMPLAASKIRVRELPFEITLTDEMAMIPSLRMSAFPELVVGARISISGQPLPQSGDLYVETSPVKAGDMIELEINQILKK